MNKKIIIIFTVLLLVILLGGYFIIQYFRTQEEETTTIEEYTPEEEITEEQNRQTIVTLYFLNTEENELAPEARLVDIKEIINNPYDKIVNMLIEGPKNEKYSRLIPENTQLNQTYLEGDMLYLDFSSNFLNYDTENEIVKQFLIDSLVNTLTQLTEVNSIKILIDGEENGEFNEIYQLENN